MVQFLSDEFMSEATSTLGDHAGFVAAAANVELGLQFIVSDGPDGEIPYYVSITDGAASVATGTLDDPDVSITNSYETAVGISKGDINTQMAFMTGKLKVSGNMAKLLMHQGLINEFMSALSTLDLEYGD